MAIHAGVPVVDYKWSDTRIFMAKSTLATNYERARKQINQLVRSRGYRERLAHQQMVSLTKYNESAVPLLCSVIDRFLALNKQISADV